MVKVRVPATSANIGSGFDTLGIALDLCNEICIEESNKSIVTSDTNENFPNGKDNLIHRAASLVYQTLGKKSTNFKIEQSCNVPIASGLGSSSACIVAGAVGANALLGKPFSDNELLSICLKMEGHPDNIAPCLLGGFVVSAVDNEKVYSMKLDVPDKYCFITMTPDTRLLTDDSRGVLPNTYQKSEAIYNIQRSSLMVAALSSGNDEMLKIACKDALHQDRRGALMPEMKKVFELADSIGDVFSYLSGAGPTLAFCVLKDNAKDFINNMQNYMDNKQISHYTMRVLDVDKKGAQVL